MITIKLIVSDFVITIKLIVSDLYSMYVDLQKKYDDLEFQTFNTLGDHTCDVLHIVLWLEP